MWCDLDFKFELAVVILILKILAGINLGNNMA